MILMALFLVGLVHGLNYTELGSGSQLEGPCQDGLLYLRNNSQVGFKCTSGQYEFDACYPLRQDSVRIEDGRTWYDSKKEGTLYQCTEEEFAVRGCMRWGRFYKIGQVATIEGAELEARRIWDAEVCKYKCAMLPPDDDSLCEKRNISSEWGKHPDAPFVTPSPTTMTSPVTEEESSTGTVREETTTIPIAVTEKITMSTSPSIETTPSPIENVTVPVLIPKDMNISGADVIDETNIKKLVEVTTLPPEIVVTEITTTTFEPTSSSEEQVNKTTQIVEYDVIVEEKWIEPKKVENLAGKDFPQRFRRKCSKRYWSRYRKNTKRFCAKAEEDKFEGCPMLAPVCSHSILAAFRRECLTYPHYSQFIPIFNDVITMKTVGEMARVVPRFFDSLMTLAGAHFESYGLYHAVELMASIFDTRYANLTIIPNDPKCSRLVNGCSNRDELSCSSLLAAENCHPAPLHQTDCCSGCLQGPTYTRHLVEILCPETCMTDVPSISSDAMYSLGYDIQDVFTCPN